MPKTTKEKNSAQRERQQQLREQAKRERKPSRDDIARVLLHWTITGSAGKGQIETLRRVEDEIVALLVQQGFDEEGLRGVLRSDRALHQTPLGLSTQSAPHSPRYFVKRRLRVNRRNSGERLTTRLVYPALSPPVLSASLACSPTLRHGSLLVVAR